MTNCIYKIKFSKSTFDLNEDYERLSDYEKERVAELDAESYFDYEDDDDKYVCFIITSPLEMKCYLEILSKNLIGFESLDISKDILSHKIDLNIELKGIINTLNSIKWSFFIDDVDEWIESNLDIDTILDRISELGGVDKLSNTEKNFLKNHH